MKAFFWDRWRLHNSLKAIQRQALPFGYRLLTTPLAQIRLRDTGGDKPCLLIVPDGPNVIEHYDELIALLQADFRVICFDLPGFGFSFPRRGWDYSFSAGTLLIRSLLDELRIEQAALSFPCANGYYALAFAEAYPQRVSHLMIVQTPAMSEMQAWTKRIVPKILRIPLLGQIVMGQSEQKFATKWYDYALPKGKDRSPWQQKALDSVQHGGCFCLASLSQGLQRMAHHNLTIPEQVSASMVFGDTDFTHRPTNFMSAQQFRSGLSIEAFSACGHFPDLEAPEDFAALLKRTILS